jgi:peptide/nickel transport system substrate-binding protein
MLRKVSLAMSLVALACSDNTSSATGRGTLIVVTPEDPGSLFPPLAVTTAAKQITEQLYDYLADVGPDLDTRNEQSYRRELADGWRWSRDSLSLSFHINPRARWHDGAPVTARDVRFTFALNKNPVVASRFQTSLENIDSVTIADSLTATVWFHERRLTQFLDAAAQLLILPAHQLEQRSPGRIAEDLPPPIGSGRFRLQRWNKGTSVEVVADTANYRGRPNLDRVIWSVTPDHAAGVARLFVGDADLLELRSDDAPNLARHPNVRALILPGMDYAFLRFNLRDPANKSRPHPLFGDRELRRAIAMSIDRATIVRSVFDTLAVVPSGPTVHAFSSTDPHLTQIPFDSARASHLLDSLGWRRGPNGMRSRKGKPLAFRVMVPSASANRTRTSVLLQEQLRRMGIRVELDRMELPAQTARAAGGDFDAELGAWSMHSSTDAVRDAWGTIGIGKNGVNYGAYSNRQFDALLDSALTSDPAHERARFTAAYQVINDDAPAVWLYEPRKILGIHDRFKTVNMRPDAWWFSLADWSVDPARRIQRDKASSAH